MWEDGDRSNVNVLEALKFWPRHHQVASGVGNNYGRVGIRAICEDFNEGTRRQVSRASNLKTLAFVSHFAVAAQVRAKK